MVQRFAFGCLLFSLLLVRFVLLSMDIAGREDSVVLKLQVHRANIKQRTWGNGALVWNLCRYEELALARGYRPNRN